MKKNSVLLNRRSIRLKDYDYSQEGLYFITICTEHRKNVFGEILNGEMKLNKYGKIAYAEWLKTTEIRNNIELGNFVIMPNHMHAIVRILCRGVLHTPDYVLHTPDYVLHTPNHVLHSPNYNTFHISDLQNGHDNQKIDNCNAQENETYRTKDMHNNNNEEGVCNTPLQSPSQTIGSIIRGYKSSVTKQLGLLGYNEKLWQRNYHEHIIRNNQSFLQICNYIINNPVNWDNDVFK